MPFMRTHHKIYSCTHFRFHNYYFYSDLSFDPRYSSRFRSSDYDRILQLSQAERVSPSGFESQHTDIQSFPNCCLWWMADYCSGAASDSVPTVGVGYSCSGGLDCWDLQLTGGQSVWTSGSISLSSGWGLGRLLWSGDLGLFYFLNFTFILKKKFSNFQW